MTLIRVCQMLSVYQSDIQQSDLASWSDGVRGYSKRCNLSTQPNSMRSYRTSHSKFTLPRTEQKKHGLRSNRSHDSYILHHGHSNGHHCRNVKNYIRHWSLLSFSMGMSNFKWGQDPKQDLSLGTNTNLFHSRIRRDLRLCNSLGV